MKKSKLIAIIQSISDETTGLVAADMDAEFNKKIDTLKNNIKTELDKVNENNRYLQKLSESQMFISWIASYNWTSKSLADESVYKVIEDISYDGPAFNSISTNAFNTDAKPIQVSTWGINSTGNYAVSLDRPTCCEYTRCYNERESKPKPIRFEERVAGLIKYPWKYSTRDIIKVADYLKKQYEKDCEIKKYK